VAHALLLESEENLAMNEVHRSLVGGSRAKKAKAWRFTMIVVLILLSWLLIAWILGRVAIGP
jgi:hypothetical protein